METKQRGGSAARDALESHRWAEAFDLLSEADRQRPLEPEDLEALAQAAWFTAQADLAIEAKERAFKGYLDRGNRTRAAALAFDVGHEYILKRKLSIASAWASRGERLLQGEPESFAHGYLALSQSWAHRWLVTSTEPSPWRRGWSSSARGSGTRISRPGGSSSKGRF